MTPRDGEDQKTQLKKAELGKVFNSMLGGQDRGKDDSRFEVDELQGQPTFRQQWELVSPLHGVIEAVRE